MRQIGFALLAIGIGGIVGSFLSGGSSLPDIIPGPSPVPGPRTVVVIEETEDRTPQRASMLQRLQAERDLVYVEDDDNPHPSLRPYVQRASSLPYLYILDPERNVLFEGSLPEDYDSLMSLIREHESPVR